MNSKQYERLRELALALGNSDKPRDHTLGTCLLLLLNGYRQNANLQGALDRLAAWQAAERKEK